MIFHIDDLSHVLHLMTNSSLVRRHLHAIVATWSKIGDARGVQVLILWSRAVTLELVELELIFVGSTTNASFVDIVSSNSTMSFLLDKLAIQRLICHLLLGIHLLIVISAMILNVTRHVSLLVIASSLGPALQLVLDLLLLLFV